MNRPEREWCEPTIVYIRRLEEYVNYLETIRRQQEMFLCGKIIRTTAGKLIYDPEYEYNNPDLDEILLGVGVLK